MDDIARPIEYAPLSDSLTIPSKTLEAIPQAEAPAAGKPEIPAYLQETYYWAYINPRNVRLLDREFVVRTILWQQHRKLQKLAFAEIQPGQS
ncbi:hypothetical protein ACFL1C_07855, partial [Pseudomonadota bacterium]